MNDHLPPCESRLEASSLLAAGCLTAEEERNARQHLATCSACRERYEQLVAVCAGLQNARPSHAIAGASLMSRAIAKIDTGPARSGDRAAAPFRRGSRWPILAGLAIAASVVLLVTWPSFFYVAPQSPEVVRELPRQMVPVPEREPTRGAVETAVAASNRPT